MKEAEMQKEPQLHTLVRPNRMIFRFAGRSVLAPLCCFVDAFCREIVGIVYDPNVLISIRRSLRQMSGLFKQGNGVLPGSFGVKMNPFRVMLIDGISDALKIGWFRFGALSDDQMILRLNSFGCVPPWFHPTFTQIALFCRLQTQANSPPSILER